MERTWAEINLDNLKFNFKNIREKTSKNAKIMAIIKADGYGHGAVQLAKVLRKEGADRFGVALCDEGIQLRKHGIEENILILGVVPEERLEDIIEYNLTPAVASLDFAKKLNEKAKDKVKIHIKVDTVMGRIGFSCTKESVEVVKEISKLKNIEIEGIFTHFATADEENEEKTLKQFDKFMKFIDELEKEDIHIPVKHCANSATIMRYPQMHLDMVRPGIILYGYYPSMYLKGKEIELKPVMTLKSLVTHIKTLCEDSEISYGGTYTAKKGDKVATVGIGYADGLLRMLSGKLTIEINGQKFNQTGRICMDQCMIDASNANNISTGDEAVIFGEYNSADELAEICGTISYEILCMVGKRVPRIYLDSGKVVKNISFLN